MGFGRRQKGRVQKHVEGVNENETGQEVRLEWEFRTWTMPSLKKKSRDKWTVSKNDIRPRRKSSGELTVMSECRKSTREKRKTGQPRGKRP